MILPSGLLRVQNGLQRFAGSIALAGTVNQAVLHSVQSRLAERCLTRGYGLHGG